MIIILLLIAACQYAFIIKKLNTWFAEAIRDCSYAKSQILELEYKHNRNKIRNLVFIEILVSIAVTILL